jgi:hypothetical protein
MLELNGNGSMKIGRKRKPQHASEKDENIILQNSPSICQNPP